MTAETYFLTGATGLLGETFVPLLLSRAGPDAAFTLLVRNKRPWPDPRIRYVDGDLLDAEAVRRGAAGASGVVHLAALSHARSRDPYFRMNADATGRLLAIARSAGARRFVYVSSRYADPSCGAYGASKHRAEELVRNAGLPYLIVRFGELYGRRSVPGIENLAALVRKLPVVPYPDLPATFAPLSLGEAADTLCRLVLDANRVNRSYTLAGSTVYTLREMLEHIARALGVKRRYLPVPGGIVRLLHYLGRAAGLPLDEDMILRLTGRKHDNLSAARRDFGFHPVPFAQGYPAILSKTGSPPGT